MIPHQRGKQAKLHPAQYQVLCSVCAETAKICAGIQESAHVQGRHHFDVQQQMRPPGQVVTLPDPAVAVHADIRRTGEHEDPLVRLQFFKGFSCSTGHIVAVEIVDFVMADQSAFSIEIMIKAPVIFRVVGEA